MKVVVCGSWRPENNIANDLTEDIFRDYCRALGKELFEQGHDIVACSAKKSTADRWIIEGATAAAKSKKKNVNVTFVLSPTAKDQYESDESSSCYSVPGANVDYPQTSGEGWFLLYRLAMQTSDAVIIIGGSDRGCGGAAYSALAMGLPLVAIPAFHGASERVFVEVLTKYSACGCPANVVEGVKSHSAQGAKDAMAMVDHLHSHNPFQLKNKSFQEVIGLSIMIVLVVAWFLLASRSADQNYQIAAMFVAMGIGLGLKFSRSESLDEDISKDRKVILGITMGIGTVVGLKILGTLTGQAFVDGTIVSKFQTLSSLGLGVGLLTEQYFGVLTKGLSKTLPKSKDDKP